MDLLQLKYFAAVAETRSFTAAARRQHVSQPALSYQVKRLEEALGTELFTRTSRRVTLTQDGQALLPMAQEILRKVEAVEHVMSERRGMEHGEVSLGAIPSVGSQVLPHILATFRRSFPGVVVAVSEAGSMHLADAVRNGTLDLAIISTPIDPEGLDATPLLTEELLLVLPRGHELAGHGPVSLEALRDYEWIFPSEAFTLTSTILEACRAAGFQPKIAFQTGTLESVRSYVRHELGIAMLPRLALEGHEGDTVMTAPLVQAPTRDLHIVHSADRAVSSATKVMIGHIRTTVLSTFSSVGTPLRGGSPEDAPRIRS